METLPTLFLNKKIKKEEEENVFDFIKNACCLDLGESIIFKEYAFS